MKASDIIEMIYLNFDKEYKNAANFVDSGHIWDFCIGCIADPVRMNKIIADNDYGIPPVKTVAKFYKKEHKTSDGFVLGDKETHKNMGRLMGYVFKYVLGYKGKQKTKKIKMLGIKTATLFVGGHKEFVEKE